jgi:protein TonB
MYADRHARPEGIKPGSLTIAIGINAALIGGLMFASPAVELIKERTLSITNVPIDIPPPPPPVPIEPEVSSQARDAAQPEQIAATIPIVTSGASDFVLPPLPLPPLPPLPLPTGNATRVDPPVAPPVLVEAQPDPRYARDLQPQYPAGERRAEREGSVTVRVTIGPDGRVTGAECVSATTSAFCQVTLAQALAKWRFRPATRDGVAVESSRVMTARFELES